EGTISNGRALERFREMVVAQGGDPAVVDHPERLPQAPVQREFTARGAGVVSRVAPREVGHAIVALGGGRVRTEDSVDPAVGILITAKPGDRVQAGDPLAMVHARDVAGAEEALE